MDPKTIFEDENLLVIEKPAGLVVNRSATVKGKTLQDWLVGKVATNTNNREFNNRTGLVHRLDKETSGLMVIAKGPEAFVNLQAQFKMRQVVKKYLALVHGKVSPRFGDIRAPIKRNPFNRFRFGIFVDGRQSLTNYKVLDYYQNPKEKNKSKKYFSLVEVEPKTGRTHQIRVHFSHLHYPVVADDLYAGKKTSRSDRGWCPRLFLHAQYLEFNHPTTGERLKFSSDLPGDLQLALGKREKIS